jgi:cold shock CspA family protein
MSTGLSGESEQSEEVEWSQPRVLDFLVWEEDDEQSPEFDVLILDLRLFGNTGTSNKRESDLLKRLVEFYEQSDADNIEDADLKRAAHAARKQIKKTSKSSFEGPTEVMYLALLPILLSYVDPSLPIVLFSSTRQQAIIEAVAHRPNVITSFRKPVISGYGEEMSACDFVAALSDAIADALRLHEARCIWNRVFRAEWTHQPVFEAKGRESGELEVYNLPQNTSLKEHPWKEKLRVKSRGSRPPYIQGKDVTRYPGALRAFLAQHFTRYIASSRYFDYISVPSELFEGALVPSRILERPWLSNAEFALPRDLDSRNEIPRVLRNIRNKKAHGFVSPPDGKEEREKHRLASILVFLLFLDFIEEVSEPENQSKVLKELRDHLRSSYHHLRNFGGTLKPYHLINDTKVGWLEVVAFAASYAGEKTTDPDTDQVFLSKKVITAIHRLAELVVSGKQLVTGSPRPHPDPVSKRGTGERVVGEVKEYEVDGGYGFIKNPRQGRDIFFHVTELDEWIPKGHEIPSGTLIEFVVVDGDKGPEVKNAKRLL